MEDTLRDPLLAGSFVNTTGVLILVLMEDTLRDTSTFDISRVCPKS